MAICSIYLKTQSINRLRVLKIQFTKNRAMLDTGLFAWFFVQVKPAQVKLQTPLNGCCTPERVSCSLLF